MIKNILNQTKNVYRNGEVKALNLVMSGKKKVREKIKSKGGLTIIEILIILAVILIVSYPAYKGYLESFMVQAKTWLTTQGGKIFN